MDLDNYETGIRTIVRYCGRGRVLGAGLASSAPRGPTALDGVPQSADARRGRCSSDCRSVTRGLDAARRPEDDRRTDRRPPTDGQTWRLDADTGSMAPRSALDVLVDLNDKVDTGRGRRVPAGPARVHAAGQDDRRRPPGRRADADRRRPGHRQDDDGAPDGAQHRLRRPGERALHLLRARRAVPAQPADRDGVGARPPAPQDRRDQDPGRPQGDPRDVDGRGRRARRQLASNPRLRPSLDRIARYGQNLFLLRGSQTAQHDRQHPQARPAAPRAVGRPAARRLRRLPPEGAPDPGAGDRDREGHVRRQRPQGHRPVRGGRR